jgi:hypothetical protein
MGDQAHPASLRLRVKIFRCALESFRVVPEQTDASVAGNCRAALGQHQSCGRDRQQDVAVLAWAYSRRCRSDCRVLRQGDRAAR